MGGALLRDRERVLDERNSEEFFFLKLMFTVPLEKFHTSSIKKNLPMLNDFLNGENSLFWRRSVLKLSNIIIAYWVSFPCAEQKGAGV